MAKAGKDWAVWLKVLEHLNSNPSITRKEREKENNIDIGQFLSLIDNIPKSVGFWISLSKIDKISKIISAISFCIFAIAHFASALKI
jgi:hypothetical protein